MNLEPKNGETIVVWFSSGAASAVAWMKTIEKYGDRCNVVAVNNPIREEDIDNERFAHDVAKWLGSEICFWTHPDYPGASAKDVWRDKKFMSSVYGAPCTLILKKQARQDYESKHRVDWHVLGFTADEQKRYDRFVLTERSNVLPVLIEAGITKQDCVDILVANGVNPPRIYLEGYPNANCIGCVKATSPTYWNLVRQTRPQVFEERAVQSREIGAKLVRYKNKRIFLDELPEDAKGRSLKKMNIECGIFCEEKN